MRRVERDCFGRWSYAQSNANDGAFSHSWPGAWQREAPPDGRSQTNGAG